MRPIALVTDSTADIPPEIVRELDIRVVPLGVHFGEQSYLDNVNLQPAEFYEKLASFGGLPKTSQPSPGEYYNVYKQLTDEGKAVISIHLSSAFSGTYQSALLGQSMLEGEGDVTVVDSKTASYGYGMMVVQAAELASQGLSKEEIVERVLRLKAETKLYFLVETLEYLQKGGRIGKAAALFGSLLNIKPILTIDEEGYVTAFDKVRGQKKAFMRIVELLESAFPDGPVDLAAVVTPGRTEMAEELIALLREKFPIRKFSRSAIGPVIGTHAGPGTVGIFMSPASLS
ncbi:DegV family protein [Cohnella zeiphila]|uniref:DegV family protein n=1 Tax=Cohnella zeiphila TaxID=2761120 RepID=A0A7X0STH2_9BACL|nr:DegV family protein [Cohnella zeiphila]MBB6735844.1 DegV family protein [Cohnella zeiphila]